MKIYVFLALAGLTAMVLGACSNIELTPAGEQVQLMQQKLPQLDECENKGRVTVSAESINIREEKEDRDILARNNGAEMGGDVVVPVSEVDENRSQTFEVFKCNMDAMEDGMMEDGM